VYGLRKIERVCAILDRLRPELVGPNLLDEMMRLPPVRRLHQVFEFVERLSAVPFERFELRETTARVAERFHAGGQRMRVDVWVDDAALFENRVVAR